MMNIQPSREEFRELATKGNLIPVRCEVIADLDTPVSAYYKLTQDLKENEACSFLLESVEGGENIARYSFLGAEPRAIFRQDAGVARLIENGKERVVEGKDVFEKIQNVMETFKPVEIEGLPPFVGGAVGYAAYDVVSEFEKTVPQPETTPLDTPEAFFMITDTILVFDRVRHIITVVCQTSVESPEQAVDAYDQAVKKLEQVVEKLRQPFTPPEATIEETQSNDEDLFGNSNKTGEEYRKMVETGKRYIYDGDIIQTVLSQRFSMDLNASPISVHRALRMVNPSPYMFLLNCADFAVVGASPEVHARCQDRKITVRPIAGTRKRGKNENEDQALEKELLDDPKERAEHIMLVDLARNDIGRIAKTGSVSVDELMVIERYSHVMHIVSNVTGTLDDQYKADAVMRSTFPAGTLSGAPKVRAMQIISELEKERRGPYGGAVAYYSFDGNVDSAITIRTAVLKDGKAYVQAGAGIVADSDPESENQECRNKAKAMLKAISLSNMFEKSEAK